MTFAIGDTLSDNFLTAIGDTPDVEKWLPTVKLDFDTLVKMDREVQIG
jgi:hypothetical protein